ncbi:DNA polymerase III subunit delta [Paenibacillus sp. strain BS8-2]
MDIREAFKEIKGGKYRSIYVLFGKDRYRMTQFIEALTNQMFSQDQREMGIVKFDTAESPLDEAVLEAETPPFFLEQKLVLVRDVTVMAAGGKENAKIEHRPEALIRYLDNPFPSTVIVFVVHADKLDERRKIVKTLKERGSLVPFPEMEPAELKQWMVKRAAEQKRTMTTDAADLLISRVGTGTGPLAQEIDKLCLHAGEGGVIDAEQAAMLTSATVEEDVFALVDAIAELRIDRALGMYHSLLVRREEPIKIAALIARQLRIMLQIKELEHHHYSPQQMAGHLGLHPYAVKLAAEKSKKFTTVRLGQLLSAIAELDYGMKRGLIDKSLGLELYLLSLGVGKGA